ncbi:ChbG/HpnK family deacetylase [Clostridiales bacterium FE2010]|nr:ChbG/HpnK family deacetylase [Clostridiales bacterium FE2010]
MHKLIITADDYGMSKAVNKAIDSGIEAGLITATNVMTNMPYYNEAKKIIDDKSASVGMHWVLTCGQPVLPKEEIPTLVAPNGEFYDYPDFRNRYRKHMIDDDEIKKELIAQYNLFIEHVGVPDYWNTHQNFHVDFGIYAKIIQLAKELGITRMRSHQRIYVPASDDTDLMPLSWRLIEPIKSRMLNVWQGNAHKKGMRSPDGLIVNMNRSDVYRLDYTFNHINWEHNTIGEYVIHPATEADSPYFGEIVERRIWEYKSFSSDETRRTIHNADLILVNYSDI